MKGCSSGICLCEGGIYLYSLNHQEVDQMYGTTAEGLGREDEEAAPAFTPLHTTLPLSTYQVVAAANTVN